MRINSPHDAQDAWYKAEISVTLHEGEGISVNTDHNIILTLITRELLRRSPTSARKHSEKEIAVPTSFGMEELLQAIRQALNSAGYKYSEPYAETNETWQHCFRLQ